MDFDLTEAQQEIVRGVRAMCARFDDEYWRAKDAAHEFPHDFYQAVAKAGYLGVAIPEEFGGSGLGITEAALVMREVAYAGAMNAASAIHLVDFRAHANRDARHRGDEAPPSAARGQRRTARRLRRDRARRRQRHHAHQDLRQARRRQLRDQRAQGLHHQGAGSAQDAAADAHHAIRAGGEEDRGDEPVLRRRRPQRDRGARTAQARPPRGRYQHALHRQSQGLGRRHDRRRGQAASATCSTG